MLRMRIGALEGRGVSTRLATDLKRAAIWSLWGVADADDCCAVRAFFFDLASRTRGGDVSLAPAGHFRGGRRPLAGPCVSSQMLKGGVVGACGELAAVGTAPHQRTAWVPEALG